MYSMIRSDIATYSQNLTHETVLDSWVWLDATEVG